MQEENHESTHQQDNPTELELAVFPGEIVVVDSEEGLATAIEELNRCRIIGFDTESRPSFKKNQHYGVALIQLSTPTKAWLLRTNILGFSEGMRAVLEREDILKVGASLKDDTHRLRKLAPFDPKGMIDLQPLARAVNLEEQSVRKLAARLLKLRVSKRAQLSNWESATLSEKQQQYAATDAWICLKMLYAPEFQEQLKTMGYELPEYNTL